MTHGPTSTIALMDPQETGAQVQPRPTLAPSDQERALESLLRRAREVDAYKEVPGAPNQSFQDWPLTLSSEVKADPSRFRFAGATPALRVATSGSTGTPTVVYRSIQEWKENARGVAARWAPLLPAGPPRVASLLDHNRSAAGALVEHVACELDATLARLMPYTPSGANWRQLAEAFREFEPTVVIATPGVLLDVEHELRVLGEFEAIRDTTATVLTLGATNTPAMRRRLNRSWEALVTDGSFGGTEPGTIATGCRLGHLHTLAGRGVFEVTQDSKTAIPLQPGVQGELVVTPTLFHGFILVRYVTGDEVEAFNCPCGLDGVAIRVLGRTDDRIKARGHWLGQAEIEEAVFRDEVVEDYQLVADLEGNLTRVEVSLLPGSTASGTTAAETIARSLGAQVVVIEAVSPLARTAGVVKSWVRTRVRREVTR